MKKKYIIPETEIVRLNLSQPILNLPSLDGVSVTDTDNKITDHIPTSSSDEPTTDGNGDTWADAKNNPWGSSAWSGWDE